MSPCQLVEKILEEVYEVEKILEEPCGVEIQGEIQEEVG